jgi:hypothetical protein
MDERPKKVIVSLDPDAYKSTWLGNKSVYRTRMMIADDGDLIDLLVDLIPDEATRRRVLVDNPATLYDFR